MIIAIVFAYVWGVIQLIVLGSLARTVRVRTVLTALVTGLYACALLAVLLQAAWSRPAAWLIGMDFYLFRDLATHSVDPFIEEIVKLLPLVVLLTVPVIRRQWSITDCVLVAAATGSGFGLAEDLYRYGASPDHANAVNGGWMLTTSIALPMVPSLWTSVTSWLPAGVGDSTVFSVTGSPSLNLHLAWSAIGGLAVGLFRLRGGTVRLTVGALLLFYIGADHAAFNAGYQGDWVAAALRWLRFGALRELLGLMPIAALAVAWWLDRGRQHGLEPLLAVERSASPRILGTLQAAVSQLPWSLSWLSSFVRMRRAYNSTRASGSGDDTERLRAVVVEAQNRIEQETAPLKSLPWAPSFWPPRAVLVVMRRPMVLVWLVLMTPSILWFVVGGWPRTAGLQAMLMGPVAWKVVVLLSAVSQTLTLWYLVIRIRAWPTARRLPVGEDGAIFGLRIAGQLGALGLGGWALLLAFTGLSPTHALSSPLCAYCAWGDLAVSGAMFMTGAPPLMLLGAVLGGTRVGDLQRADAAAAAAAAAADPVAKARSAKEAWEKAEARQAAASDAYNKYRADFDRLKQAAADAETAKNNRAADREANSKLGPEAEHLADDRMAKAYDAATKATHEAAAAKGALRGAMDHLEAARADADAAAKAYAAATEAQTRAGAVPR